MRRAAFVVFTSILAGCASTPSDFTDYEKTQASTIEAYPIGENTPEHRLLGKVESNSCDSKTTARYSGSQEEALLLLKLETVRVGGDMVIGYSCSTRGVDLVSNCWASQRCEGLAAKAK